MITERQVEGNIREKPLERTVDGNSHTFVQSVAIGTNESWNFSKLVDLEVVSRDPFGWFGFDNLEFDVVGLGHSADSGGAGIALRRRVSTKNHFGINDLRSTKPEDIPGRCRAFRKAP